MATQTTPGGNIYENSDAASATAAFTQAVAVNRDARDAALKGYLDTAVAGKADAAALNGKASKEELAAAIFNRGELPENTDLASTTPLSQGLWTVSTSALGNTIGDWPASASASRTGSVLVVKTGTRYTYTVTSTSTGEIYQKFMPSGAWRPWEKIHPFSQEHTGITNRILVEDFTRRMGGVKDTGGLGAVSFRFDHGLNNFKTKVLPLLQAYGIKASLALNSRTWTAAENNAVTQSEVDGWVAAGYVEIWNHGATHGDAVMTSALTTEIVTSLAELRAQLPSAQIDGFAVPGVGGTNYGGFDGGATTADFFDTVAGRMILATHAVSSGSISGTDTRILDGVVRNGQAHYTLDAQTAATAKAKINTARTSRRGQQFMLHPSVLDTAGNMTTAVLGEILAYAAAEREARRIKVLSPYEMLLASSRSPHEPIELGTEHIDGIKTPGSYVQSDDAEATTATGYPVTRAGFLTVQASPNRTIVRQVYSPRFGASYSRTCYNDVWVAWVTPIQ